MKLLKILVIFLFATILTIVIYNGFNNRIVSIFSIGDSLSLTNPFFDNPANSYNYYIDKYHENLTVYSQPNLSYKELYNKIYYDDELFYKGQYINIKHIIHDTDIIIISANNKEFFNKCNKTQRIVEEYLDNIFDRITDVIDIISIVKNSKVIVLSPYCIKYDKTIDTYIDKYYVYKNVEFINLNKLLHEKSYYLLEKNKFPTSEGHYYIYSEISKKINSFM